MAAKNKLELNFEGFEDVLKQLRKLEADVKSIAEKALEESFKTVTPGIEQAIAAHKRTGATAASLVKEPKVEWAGDVASVPIGFDIKGGGMASIFLMYGSPRHAAGNQYGRSRQNPGFPADKTLYNAIYGTKIKKQVEKVQEEIFQSELRRRMQ